MKLKIALMVLVAVMAAVWAVAALFRIQTDNRGVAIQRFSSEVQEIKTATNRMTVLTDLETGCQYLLTYAGITPRLGASGRQMCGRVDVQGPK